MQLDFLQVPEAKAPGRCLPGRRVCSVCMCVCGGGRRMEMRGYMWASK